MHVIHLFENKKTNVNLLHKFLIGNAFNRILKKMVLLCNQTHLFKIFMMESEKDQPMKKKKQQRRKTNQK